MTRNNADFQASALYHGTLHPFQVGDIVEPRSNDGYAYATPSIDYAEEHMRRQLGGKLWEQAKEENPTYNTPTGKQYHQWLQEQKPKIFQVEPIDSSEVTPSSKLEDEGNFASKKGFRVVKQVK